jgi:hypothetical protein
MTDLAITLHLDEQSCATLAQQLAAALTKALPGQRASANDTAPVGLREAAKRIGCSLSKLRQMIGLGRVRTVRLSGKGRGKRILIEPAEIERVKAEARR